MPEYFSREEAMARLHQYYRSAPQRQVSRDGNIIEIAPRTAKVVAMVPVDCWVVGVAWADTDEVVWLNQEEFYKMFNIDEDEGPF